MITSQKDFHSVLQKSS